MNNAATKSVLELQIVVCGNENVIEKGYAMKETARSMLKLNYNGFTRVEKWNVTNDPYFVCKTNYYFLAEDTSCTTKKSDYGHLSFNTIYPEIRWSKDTEFEVSVNVCYMTLGGKTSPKAYELTIQNVDCTILSAGSPGNLTFELSRNSGTHMLLNETFIKA